MASGKQTIKLNGKEYDSQTGKIIHSPSSEPSTSQTLISKPVQSVKLIDGFRAPRKTPTAGTRAGRTLEHSKTLMRTVVKKPATIKPEKRTTQNTTPQAHFTPTAPSPQIKPERLERASQTPKSSLIKKFAINKNFTRTDVVPVKPAPVHNTAHIAPPPVLVAQSSVNQIDRISAALEKADGHLQPKLKKQGRYRRLTKKLHLSTTVLAGGITGLLVITVGGWLAYNNVPNIAMRIAAAKAGVQAELPAYRPAGFSLKQPISYNAGEVNLNFISNTDDRTYNVVQKTSSWDSQALLENVIENNPYQTVQSSGRTIYIYDNNAVWVDSGTLFKIEGNSILSSDQLLKIADSLR